MPSRAVVLSLLAAGCAAQTLPPPARKLPLVIDRFSDAAGHLQRRSAQPGLPGAGEAVDFDRPPFITQSHGPGGEIIRYYNFDVQPVRPATMYLVDGVGVVDVVPGGDGYSDFFRLVRVVVPDGAEAGGLHDVEAIRRSGFALEETSTIVNRPIVPSGSTARERLHGAPAELERGWYRGQTVTWFRFDESHLEAGLRDPVPTSPIYVTFNLDPDRPGGGPPSGFRTEPDGVQTHNVASSLPGDLDYSPLWLVSVFARQAFAQVLNQATVLTAPFVARDVATVNCPIVFVAAVGLGPR